MAGSRQGQGQAFRRQSLTFVRRMCGVFPSSYPLSIGAHGVGWRRGTGDGSLEGLQGAGSSQAWVLGVPWPWPSREGGQSLTHPTYYLGKGLIFQPISCLHRRNSGLRVVVCLEWKGGEGWIPHTNLRTEL